ncbi:MAG: DUF4469 domain-containing protein [Bacteroidales bacterium]|jgi:hypothetical protein|nr:DUF4469 domain-containing protein [Bacteroidales bacterium]
MKKHVWKVWLRPNKLTKDILNDYIGEVSTVGNTIKNADIAQRIVDEGSEIKYETIVSILDKSDKIIIENLLKGGSVQTGYCHVAPRVHGNWIGTVNHHDPDKQKPYLSMTITAEVREALKQVTLEVLGVKESGAHIGLVTDTSTGKSDGSVTPNEDVIIEGEKIKIFPDDDDSLGIFFVKSGGEKNRVTHRLLQNDPKKIIARVPTYLVSGEYSLVILTRYSQGKTLLKDVRTITYNTPIIVK